MFGILSRKPKSGRSHSEFEPDSKKRGSMPSDAAIQAKNKASFENGEALTATLNQLGDDTIRNLDVLRSKIGDMRIGAEEVRSEVRRVSRRK